MTTGDGHDLRSPRFAGDPVLEACYDGKKALRKGDSGPAVEKIQQALIDAGFPLPKFGADGDFGNETVYAVTKYQQANRLKADGIVGFNTIKSLDDRFAAAKPSLTVGQKIPNKNEVDVVGAIIKKVVRGTPEFNSLVKNTNSDIVFKDEEGTGADCMMTPRLKAKLDVLANFVKKEWLGKKLRVTEAWDETNEHTANSIHYEGRAADITVSDRDTGKLGRLAQLAVDSGFDWVWYENALHVHASVTK